MKLLAVSSNLKRGFTLVEMAIALVILGLMLGGLLIPLSAQIDMKNLNETRKALDEAKEALTGYALSNKHLPCPDRRLGGSGGTNDSANDGIEDYDAATGSCKVTDGNLPWSTLGLPAFDPWNHHYRYHVTPTFTNRAPLSSFGLSDKGTVRICNDAACSSPTLTNAAVAVVFSQGKNGGNCSITPSSPACADEAENTDGDNDFVSHTPTAPSATGEFDDVLTWISSSILLNRMVASGQLP